MWPYRKIICNRIRITNLILYVDYRNNLSGRQLMTEVATGESTLNWDVLVTPGIPTVASDRAPRTKQLMWSPISSTLISGKRDAVLVDHLYYRRASGRPRKLGCGERQEPDNDLCHPRTSARELYDKVELYPDRVNPEGALWL